MSLSLLVLHFWRFPIFMNAIFSPARARCQSVLSGNPTRPKTLVMYTRLSHLSQHLWPDLGGVYRVRPVRTILPPQKRSVAATVLDLVSSKPAVT